MNLMTVKTRAGSRAPPSPSPGSAPISIFISARRRPSQTMIAIASSPARTPQPCHMLTPRADARNRLVPVEDRDDQKGDRAAEHELDAVGELRDVHFASFPFDEVREDPRNYRCDMRQIQLVRRDSSPHRWETACPPGLRRAGGGPARGLPALPASALAPAPSALNSRAVVPIRLRWARRSTTGCSSAGRRAAATRTRRAGFSPDSGSPTRAASAVRSTRSSARSPTSSRRSVVARRAARCRRTRPAPSPLEQDADGPLPRAIGDSNVYRSVQPRGNRVGQLPTADRGMSLVVRHRDRRRAGARSTGAVRAGEVDAVHPPVPGAGTLGTHLEAVRSEDDVQRPRVAAIGSAKPRQQPGGGSENDPARGRGARDVEIVEEPGFAQPRADQDRCGGLRRELGRQPDRGLLSVARRTATRRCEPLRTASLELAPTSSSRAAVPSGMVPVSVPVVGSYSASALRRSITRRPGLSATTRGGPPVAEGGTVARRPPVVERTVIVPDPRGRPDDVKVGVPRRLGCSGAADVRLAGDSPGLEPGGSGATAASPSSGSFARQQLGRASCRTSTARPKSACKQCGPAWTRTRDLPIMSLAGALRRDSVGLGGGWKQRDGTLSGPCRVRCVSVALVSQLWPHRTCRVWSHALPSPRDGETQWVRKPNGDRHSLRTHGNRVGALVAAFGSVALVVAAGVYVSGVFWAASSSTSLGYDLQRIALQASDAIVHGRPVYGGGFNYVYPPFYAELVLPLLAIPASVLSWIAAIASLAMILSALVLVGVRDVRRALALAALSETEAMGAQVANASSFVCHLVALTWRWRGYRGEVALAIAIAVKLYVWPLELWLAVRQGRGVFFGR